MRNLITAPIILFFALLLSIVDFPLPGEQEAHDKRYTGITEHCIQDIAYDASFNQRIIESGNRINKAPKFGLMKKK